MMPTLALRPYQVDAVVAVRQAWEVEGLQRPAVVMATGAGKTIVFSDIAAKIAAVDSSSRTLVVAHREELIDQAVRKLRSAMPGHRIGVVKGERDEVGADVVVATVQTLRHASRRERLRNVGLVVVDECHHATAPSYRAVLGHFGCMEEPSASGRRARAVGFTATMSRADGDALGAVWQRVVYKRGIAELISEGYLVAPRGITVRVEDLDLDRVKKSRGDYQDGALGAALSNSMAPHKIVEAWFEHASDRPTILFAPTVAFAELMRDAFREKGITSEVVHGKQSPEERRKVLDDFSAGRVQVVCNCMVLTEGTDLPLASCCVLSRPTTHHSLYIQMVGRVLRPYPGKTDALVLDVAGASKRHSLTGSVDLDGAEPRELVDKLDEDELEDGDELDIAESAVDFGTEFGTIYRDGQLVVEHVDLFHGSGAAWNRTYGGTWFLEVGERKIGRYIVLVERGGDWWVAEVTRAPGQATRRGPTGSAWVACAVPDLGYAMGIAEAEVTWQERMLADKGSPWRAKPVTQTQWEMLRRFRLDDRLAPGARSAEASALIGRHIASDRIDGPLTR